MTGCFVLKLRIAKLKPFKKRFKSRMIVKNRDNDRAVTSTILTTILTFYDNIKIKQHLRSFEKLYLPLEQATISFFFLS